MDQAKRLMILLALLAEQAGEQVSETRIEFIARKLLPLGPEKVCAALERMLESARRFPTVADIKGEMGIIEPSPRDEAMMLAETLISAVRKYGDLPPGHFQGALAIERAIGPAAWALAIKLGGWNSVVDRIGENQSAFRAQARDVAEAYLKSGIIERGKVPASLPSHSNALDNVRVERPALPPKDKSHLETKLVELRAERARLLGRGKSREDS